MGPGFDKQGLRKQSQVANSMNLLKREFPKAASHISPETPIIGGRELLPSPPLRLEKTYKKRLC